MNVNVTFTTRHDGDIRKKKTGDTIFAEQVHGNKIAVVYLKDKGKTIAGVDGLVSGDHVRLGVVVADCVPILAYDDDRGVIGAVHAGWKGTLGNIAGNLIGTMQMEGADPKKIRAFIGPHIGACCYDVPKQRAKRFLAITRQAASFFEGRWHVDIGFSNYTQLIAAGIEKNNIHAPVFCTSCQVDRYFSYRKDTKDSFGEQMGSVWIES